MRRRWWAVTSTRSPAASMNSIAEASRMTMPWPWSMIAVDDGREDRRGHHVDLATDAQDGVIVGKADIDTETIQLAVSGLSRWHYLRHRSRRSWRGYAECPNPHCRRCLRLHYHLSR